MKEGEIYLYKKGQMFRVVKTFNVPTILMKFIGHNDSVVDTVETWENLKMKKLFP